MKRNNERRIHVAVKKLWVWYWSELPLATCSQSISILNNYRKHNEIVYTFSYFHQIFPRKIIYSWTDEGTQFFHSSENVRVQTFHHKRHFPVFFILPLELFCHWNLNGYLYLPNNNDNDFIRFENFSRFSARGKSSAIFSLTQNNIFPMTVLLFHET